MYDLKEYNKQYYLKNKEQKLKRNREWRMKNKEYFKEYERQRYVKNKTEHNAISKAYYYENKDKWRGYYLNWVKKKQDAERSNKIDKLNERLKSEGLDELIKYF